MQGSDQHFYFALPRLIAHLRGQNATCSENNWLEANIVGTTMHLIAFVFAAHLLLANLPTWQQVLLSAPLVLLVLLGWIVLFAVNHQLIRLLHALGLFRQLPNFRIQSVLAGAVVTAFAWQLVLAGSWMRVLGLAWIVAVLLNLTAAALLAVTHAAEPAAD